MLWSHKTSQIESYINFIVFHNLILVPVRFLQVSVGERESGA